MRVPSDQGYKYFSASAASAGPHVRFLVANLTYLDGLVALFTFDDIYPSRTFARTALGVLTFGSALHLTAGLASLGHGQLPV
ncbi:MAG: hypothetical protein L0Z62_50215 [Gemmataceae bacterium]|nr:hypothetical protein [Gemmataceae bacterium]